MRAQRSQWLGLVTGMLVVSTIAMAGWIYSATNSERRASEVENAELKLSLELYGRQYLATSTSIADVNSTLKTLEERIESFEAKLTGIASLSARQVETSSQTLPAPESAALQQVKETPEPRAPETAPMVSAPAPRADCVPQNSPFLVAAGDIFPVCGTSGWVAVTEVGQQSIAFADGNAAYVGRSFSLSGTSCLLRVRSANAAWLAGYGEVEVVC